MEVHYASRRIETLCLNDGRAKKALGPKAFRKLRARLKDLEAAASVRDLVAGRPHPLHGDRKEQFALDLVGGMRLVFEAAHEETPRRADGGIAWEEVTSVRIVFIGDYHG